MGIWRWRRRGDVGSSRCPRWYQSDVGDADLVPPSISLRVSTTRVSSAARFAPDSPASLAESGSSDRAAVDHLVPSSSDDHGERWR